MLEFLHFPLPTANDWQMFGTSGVEVVPVHGSMLALLNRKAPVNYHINQHVKVIVQPLRVEAIEALHRAVYEEKFDRHQITHD